MKVKDALFATRHELHDNLSPVWDKVQDMRKYRRLHASVQPMPKPGISTYLKNGDFFQVHGIDGLPEM